MLRGKGKECRENMGYNIKTILEVDCEMNEIVEAQEIEEEILTRNRTYV